MEKQPQRTKLPGVLTAASVVILIAALHFAQPLLMPLAMATLISVVLTPVVKRIENFGLPRVAAVILVAVLSTGVLASLGYVVFGQTAQLVTLLPEYRENVKTKMRSLRESVASLERAARRVKELEKDLAAAAPAEAEAPPVKVVEPSPSALSLARQYLGSVAGPLATFGLVIVMVIFILIQREDLRDRLIRVLGSRDLWMTTSAMDDITDRVTRYLRAYTLLNAGHGVAVAVGLWIIGLPAALLFGLIAATLRFIPYVGPWISAILPVTLSVAVFEHWSGTLMVIGYLAALELVSNNVFEPLLYGSSVGLSPFAVIIAAVFWAWMWGGLGLVLAIPLTVCLVVLGRYLPYLRFLVVLLGDEPALVPPIRLFQRLLARDTDEAEDLVEEECSEHGVDHAFDALLLPALALVDYERKIGRLDEEQIEEVRQSFEVLAGSVEKCAIARGDCAANGAEPESGPAVLCIPTAAFGDELACELAARILRRHCLRAASTPRLLTGEIIGLIEKERPAVVLLSALPPSGIRSVKHLSRRLLGDAPEFLLVIGMWGVDELDELQRDLEDQPVRVVSSFADARRIIDQRLSAPKEPAANGSSLHDGRASASAARRAAG